VFIYSKCYIIVLSIISELSSGYRQTFTLMSVPVYGEHNDNSVASCTWIATVQINCFAHLAVYYSTHQMWLNTLLVFPSGQQWSHKMKFEGKSKLVRFFVSRSQIGMKKEPKISLDNVLASGLLASNRMVQISIP